MNAPDRRLVRPSDRTPDDAPSPLASRDPPRAARSHAFAARVAAAVLIVALALAAWTLVGVLMTVFGSILFAIALHGLAGVLQRRLHWPWRRAFGAAVALVLLGAAGLGWALGARIADQAQELIQILPQTVERVRAWLSTWPLGESLLRSVGGLGGQSMLDRMGKLAGSTAGALGNLVVVLFLGVYLAADPGLYRRGALALVPRPHRERAGQVLDESAESLAGWLRGQAISMVVVGVATGAGLALLGVPLAMTLGLIAAICEFVPFVGPIIAAVPAVLLAFTLSPQVALWTVLLYFVLQQLEGNLLQPLIQQRTAELPPALTVIAVVAGGALLGPAGLLLGVPLAVVAMVATRRLWAERIA